MSFSQRFSFYALLFLVAISPLQAYELADILDAPYSFGLVSAKDAEKIAWVTTDKGVIRKQT